MDADTSIRERAYLLWEQAGRPEGSGEEFWHAAAASLAAEAAPAEAKAAATRKAASAVTSRIAAGKPAKASASMPRAVLPADV